MNRFVNSGLINVFILFYKFIYFDIVLEKLCFKLVVVV